MKSLRQQYGDTGRCRLSLHWFFDSANHVCAVAGGTASPVRPVSFGRQTQTAFGRGHPLRSSKPVPAFGPVCTAFLEIAAFAGVGIVPPLSLNHGRPSSRGHFMLMSRFVLFRISRHRGRDGSCGRSPDQHTGVPGKSQLAEKAGRGTRPAAAATTEISMPSGSPTCGKLSMPNKRD